MTTLYSCKASEKFFLLSKKEEFTSQPLKPEKIISEKEIEYLPECIKKYIKYTRAIGKSIPQNVRIEFKAEMFRKPRSKPMKSNSVQYNFFNQYSRLFLMKSGIMGIPLKALHIYKNNAAIFQVKVAELFKVVNQSGSNLTKVETVTLLNDMCLFAPGRLIDNRLKWTEIDSLSTKVSLTNGDYTVSAILYFNILGELINFVSEDRCALQNDGTLKQARWSTPVSDYKEFEDRRIPTIGKTIWHYAEGDFTYGIFELKSIKYNVDE